MMRTVLALLALVAAPALAEAGPNATREATPVEAWIERGIRDGNVAAAAIANVHGKDLSTHGFGRVRAGAQAPDGDTRFQLGSITKVFTNLLLAEMAAAGEVRYEQALGTLMPDGFTPRNAGVASITLESLATHRSGLPRLPANLALDDAVDPYGRYTVEKLHEGLATARDQQPLGAFYTYSNFGVGTLGHVLGRRHGKGYRAALGERVLTPLRIEHTGFEAGEAAAQATSAGKPVHAWRFTDAFDGAGALWGSASDLGRLVQAFLGTHEHGLRHELKADLVPVRETSGAPRVTRVWHVAHAGDEPIFWHNGGTAGFHSFVGFRPDQQRGIAVLVSGDADPTEAALLALGATPRPPAASSIDRTIFGRYRLAPQFELAVDERDGVLQLQATGQPAFALHALGDDWYAIGEVDASVHFVRDGGAVTAMQLAQGGVVQSAPRVADAAGATARGEE